MKKFAYMIISLMFLLPLALVGCNQNNNSKPASVEYTYVTHSRESHSSGDFLYTFQIDVKNNTSESIYILASDFSAKTIYNNASTHENITRDVVTHVYTDQTKTNEITLSQSLSAGQSQTLYIETRALNASAYGEYLLYVNLYHLNTLLKSATHN